MMQSFLGLLSLKIKPDFPVASYIDNNIANNTLLSLQFLHSTSMNIPGCPMSGGQCGNQRREHLWKNSGKKKRNTDSTTRIIKSDITIVRFSQAHRSLGSTPQLHQQYHSCDSVFARWQNHCFLCVFFSGKVLHHYKMKLCDWTQYEILRSAATMLW